MTETCIRNGNKTRFELPESSSLARKNKNKTFRTDKRFCFIRFQLFHAKRKLSHKPFFYLI